MKTDRIILASLGILSFLYLALQVFPSLPAGDSAELITSSYVLGNAHPPGYPLFSILGKMIFLLPLGNPALAMNLMQVILGALAVALIYHIVRMMLLGSGLLNRDSRLAALFSAFFLLSSAWFIEQATITEVFVLNLLLSLLIFYSVWEGNYGLAGFAAGLGMGNQHTIVLVFPSVLLMLVARGNSRFRKAVSFLIWFIAGLSVYIYMPIRAAADPPINWSDPDSPVRMLNVFLRRNYGTFTLHQSSGSFSLEKAGMILSYFFSRLYRAFSLPGIILFITGIIAGFRKYRRTTCALIIFFIVSGPIFFIAANMEPDKSGISILERFFMLPFTAGILITAFGISVLPSRVRPAVILLPAWLLLANYIPSSAKPDVLEEYLRDVSVTIRPDEPLYIFRGGVGDDLVFGIAYKKWVEGTLPDLEVYSEYASIFPPPVAVDRPAVFATYDNKLGGRRLFQSGLLFKNYRSDMDFEQYEGGHWDRRNMTYRQRNIAVNYPLFQGMQLFASGSKVQGEKKIGEALALGGDIAWVMNNIGNVYRDSGMDSKAYSAYSKAVELDPDLAPSYNNLANISYSESKYEDAVKLYLKAIAIEPDAVRYYNLGLAYLAEKDYRKAEGAFKAAIELRKHYVSPYNDLGLAYYRSGDNSSAVSVFEEGLRIDGSNMNLLFNMGLALERLDRRRARTYWKKYLEIAPPEDNDRATAEWYLNRDSQ